MSLIPRNLFWDFERFFENGWPELRLPRIMPKGPMIRTPRMDIYEDNGNIVAEAELPGVDPKNIDVEVKDNVLKVEASAEKKKEEKGKGYYRKELSRGYFRRAIPLPVDVVDEKAEASYDDGVLKVIIPKAEPKKKEEKKGRKIKVKTKSA